MEQVLQMTPTPPIIARLEQEQWDSEFEAMTKDISPTARPVDGSSATFSEEENQ